VLLPVALVDVVLPAATAGALAATTAAAKARLDALAALRPAVVEPAVPVPLATCAGDVALDGVSGGWSSSPAFRGVDVRLARGECLGVVGPSGSGKSTLVAALLRFVDPLEGAVALDGRPLDAVSLDDVRRHVGLVDDDPHVFASTLVENVRLARPGATDAEVLEALRRADLGDWVAGLPDGIDTWLGDGSAEVSGGERARIGLARAILADPAVLVLDEPTAHLDHATARRVVDTLLDTDPRDRTIVWVTHTDDGLDRMDAVLDLGRHQAAAPPPVGVLSG
jgi:ATP-binding cassette subfamily C protein CydCD